MNHLGLNVGSENFTDLDYADDDALFKDSPGGWRTSLQKIKDDAGTMELHTSWVKQRYKTWDPGVRQFLTNAGQTVDVTVKITYLGSDIDSSGYCSPDVRRRLGLASSSMGQLYRVWRNKRLSTPTKILIYSTRVLRCCFTGPKAEHY